MLLGPNYTDQDYINLYVEQLRLLKRLQQQFQYEVNICAVQGLSDRITKIVLTPLETAMETITRDVKALQSSVAKTDPVLYLCMIKRAGGLLDD
jgi:hypothetical protein